MHNKKAPAMAGCDYVRDEKFQPMVKTRKGWLSFANRMARKHRLQMDGVVAYIEHRECYRVTLTARYKPNGD